MFNNIQWEELNNLYFEDFVTNKMGLDLNKDKLKCFNAIAHKHGDNKPSMGYMKDAHKLHCFACQEKFDLRDLIKLKYNISDETEAFKTALSLYGYDNNITASNKSKVIAMIPNIDKQQTEEEQSIKKEVNFYNNILNISKQQTAESLQHIKDRGLSDETISKYMLGYTPMFTDVFKGYNDLIEAHNTQAYNLIDKKSKNDLNGFYIAPVIDADEKITYFIAETKNRNKKRFIYANNEYQEEEITKYLKPKTKDTGLEAKLFNERYIASEEPIIFITERFI